MSEPNENPFAETVRQAEDRVQRRIEERTHQQLGEENRRARLAAQLEAMSVAVLGLCRDFSKATGAEARESQRVGEAGWSSFYIQVWTLSIHVHLSGDFAARDCGACSKKLSRDQAFVRAAVHDPRHQEQQGFGDWPEKQVALLDFRPGWLADEIKSVYLRYCETQDFMEYRRVRLQADRVLRLVAASYGLWALAGGAAAFQWWVPAAALAALAGGVWPAWDIGRAWTLRPISWSRRAAFFFLEGLLAPIAFLARFFYLPGFLRHLPRLRHPRPFPYFVPDRPPRF